jgi:hypothetical protein
MSDQEEQMGEVIVTANNKSWFKESLLEPEVIRKIPGANAGIENILKPYQRKL